ncbi:uncharacterized protein [Apostichopus japonicus]|uniref:uncharacterized protein isoform X2 n=1 Tax=Stichopus japonicus TaxID=307972 RepID=UPI003AB75EF6
MTRSSISGSLLICITLIQMGLANDITRHAIINSDQSLSCRGNNLSIWSWTLDNSTKEISYEGNKYTKRNGQNQSVLIIKMVGFEDAVDYKCTKFPDYGVAIATKYSLYVLGNLTLSTDRNVTNEGSNITADCCLQFNAHSNDMRLRWLINKESIENAQTLTQETLTTIDNHKEMCSRLMLKANRQHDGQSLGCRVEEYPSLNSSVTLQVHIYENGEDKLWTYVAVFVVVSVLITSVLILKIVKSDARCITGLFQVFRCPCRKHWTKTSTDSTTGIRSIDNEGYEIVDQRLQCVPSDGSSLKSNVHDNRNGEGYDIVGQSVSGIAELQHQGLTDEEENPSTDVYSSTDDYCHYLQPM